MGEAFTEPSPSNSSTKPASCGSCRPSCGCAPTTASPPAARSTSRELHRRHARTRPPTGALAGTRLIVLNFANEDIVDTVRSEHLPPGRWSDVGHVYRQGFCLGRRSGQLRGGDAAPPRHVAPRRRLRLRGLLGIDVVTSHGRSWQEAHRPDQGPKQRHVLHKMVERTRPISRSITVPARSSNRYRPITSVPFGLSNRAAR